MIRCLNKSYLEGGKKRPRLMVDLAKKLWSLLLVRIAGCVVIFVVRTVFTCCVCSDTFVGCLHFCLYPSSLQRGPVLLQKLWARIVFNRRAHKPAFGGQRLSFSLSPHTTDQILRKRKFQLSVNWFCNSDILEKG